MAITRAEAMEVTQKFVEDYPSSSSLIYRIKDTVEELYGSNLSQEDKKIRGGYTSGEVFFNGRIHQGRVDVALEKIVDKAAFLATLKHEVIGHHGINTFSPSEKKMLLDAIIVAAQEQSNLEILWDKITENYGSIMDDNKAEEVFAFACEGINTYNIINSQREEVQQKANEAYKETCVERIRPMEFRDLANITKMVALGLHDRSRTQQNFPKPNTLFKKTTFSETVAENLIKQLKQGTAPWQKPWEVGTHGFLPMNPTTGQRYKGINVIHLLAQGQNDPRWMTYKQASAVGGQVRQKEKGTTVEYWKFTDKKTKLDKNGQPVIENGKKVKISIKLERPKVFYASVFNASQIDGLPPLDQALDQTKKWDAIERAENILHASGAKLTHVAGDRAFYRPSTDSITMPLREQFKSSDNYYATALHELGHWTGHNARLDRDLAHPFGSQGYAKEELRAEIASMLLGNELGIGHNPEQHAAYVQSWIKVLEEDNKEIFRAAADSEKISNYVMAFEQTQEQEQNNLQEQGEMMALSKDKDKQLEPTQKEQKALEALAVLDNKDMQKRITKLENQAVQKPTQAKVYLAVPYVERVEAKAAGAKWDQSAKKWYAGAQADMGKLQRWKLGNFQIQQDSALTPREEFADAIKALGGVIENEHPIMDGNKHRVRAEDDKKIEQTIVYVGYLDGHPAGYVKNYRTGAEVKWKSKGYSLSSQDKAKLRAETAQKLAARSAAQLEVQEGVAKAVDYQIARLVHVTKPTSYMLKKGVKPHLGALTDAERKKTYIPAIDVTGKQWTMQYINEDGTKRFVKNGRKEGCFHAVGGFNAVAKAPAIVISEGYATAATNAEVLGFATVAAFDAGNLLNVAKALNKKFPDKPVVILGDDDRSQVLTQGVNTGRSKALAAAKAVGGKAFFPVFTCDEAFYPANLDPVTPEKYRAHLRATKAIEDAPEEKKAELKKVQLSQEQLSAVANMKRYSDFNDLAVSSKFGRSGVERQIKAAVISNDEQKIKPKQAQVQQQENKLKKVRSNSR